jgi:uncharacterized protein (TIGR00730 family)
MIEFKSIAVFCGSAMGKNPLYVPQAKALGAFFAKHNISLVYGGAAVGIMGILADEALANGGQVVGIIPDFFSKNEVVHHGLSELIYVKSMAERKELLAARSDAFIVLPGGFGTMDELFEVLTMSQLAIHQKSVGIFNVNGFYNPLIEQLEVMHREGYLRPNHYQMFVHDTTIEGLMEKMQNHNIYHDPNWLKWAKD